MTKTKHPRAWWLDRPPVSWLTGTSWRALHSPVLFRMGRALQPRPRHWPSDTLPVEAVPLKALRDVRTSLRGSREVLVHVDHGAGPRGAAARGAQGASRTRVVGDIAATALTSERDAEALVRMLRSFQQSGSVLELGTSLGVMTAHLVRTGWSVETWEGCPNTLAVAKAGWEALGIAHAVDAKLGTFSALMAANDTSTWDVAYLDGLHEGQATLDMLAWLAPRVRVGVVVDDVAWTADMHRAWRRAQALPEWRVSVSWRGRGVLLKAPGMARQRVRLA